MAMLNNQMVRCQDVWLREFKWEKEFSKSCDMLRPSASQLIEHDRLRQKSPVLTPH